eukprot:CAMPEP_0184405456 /NCGR_PEP_ID=MMETSP0738-20130409/695_1 /TAXON_ID=385413 /ORGANISM="Thalassiosira miniscula, Strain CCMP1093" /LENGTH=656 /DNA_ID=CAMNT_0026761933 /DNA_START=27 /DNA_END=1993 /DNA_ORIENTATION=+
MPYCFELRGRLDVDALDNAVQAVGRRYPQLTWRVTTERGEPHFEPSNQPIPFVVHRVDHLDAPAHAGMDLIKSLANQVFDLGREGPCRVDVVALSDDHHYLSVLVHHVVFDGTSAAVFFGALSEAFAGGLGGSDGAAPEVGFVTYAEALAGRIGSGGFADGVGYWGEALAGAPTVFGRVGDYADRGEAVRVAVSLGELSSAVKELARREGVTLFMLLLAVFNVALFRFSGSRDVLVGSPMSTRSSRFREAVGCFLNTVVLRSSVDEDVAFRELLRGVRRTVSEAIEHRDVPFELVLDALEVERSASHPPLVQVLFQFDHPIPLPPDSLFAMLHETYLGASLPISLICGAGGNDIEIELLHDMGGSVGDAIGRLPDTMLELLRVLVKGGASEAPLAETLAVLGPAEQLWTDAASFDHASDRADGVNGQAVVVDDVLAQVLAEFQTVLRVEDLTASAAFFDHGGDSLAALELAQQLSEAFDVKVKVLDIFEAETPAGVAERLTTLGVATMTQTASEETGADICHPVPLTPIQKGIWATTRLGANHSSAYNMPYCFELRGRLDVDALDNAVQAVGRRYPQLTWRVTTERGEPHFEPSNQPIPFVVHRVDHLDAPAHAGMDLIKSLANQVFDLGREGPCRVDVVALSDDHHYLSVLVHHV